MDSNLPVPDSCIQGPLQSLAANLTGPLIGLLLALVMTGITLPVFLYAESLFRRARKPRR